MSWVNIAVCTKTWTNKSWMLISRNKHDCWILHYPRERGAELCYMQIGHQRYSEAVGKHQERGDGVHDHRVRHDTANEHRWKMEQHLLSASHLSNQGELSSVWIIRPVSRVLFHVRWHTNGKDSTGTGMFVRLQKRLTSIRECLIN